ncbi:MAG: Na(+)/H(+) antiporter subunit C [Nocardiopsaceae bacterium]|nr:Na(+)/H(+) antiporter subunit C [Nocardiopsaceae bacterium]
MNDTPTLLLVIVVGVLVASGVVLLLERSLTRILLGVILLGNGINLMILSTSGTAGGPPLLGLTDPAAMADPLPQALILTAIVITLGVTAFLLAMAHRSWQLQGNDEVQDDAEDRRILIKEQRAELRAAIRAQRRRTKEKIRVQRMELRQRIAEADRREAAERSAMRAELQEAQQDLRNFLAEEDTDDTRRLRIANRRRDVDEGIQAARERVQTVRQELEEHARADREAEKRQRGELRRQIRAQRRQLRMQIRAERERLARAEDSDLQGAEF